MRRHKFQVLYENKRRGKERIEVEIYSLKIYENYYKVNFCYHIKKAAKTIKTSAVKEKFSNYMKNRIYHQYFSTSSVVGNISKYPFSFSDVFLQ